MSPKADATWFDAHLDLAYLAEKGRDMHAPLDDCRGPLQPASITLPSLRDGGVTACLGTLFTEGVEDPGAANAETGAHVYPLGDADAAYRAGMRQLKLYNAWADAGLIDLMPRRGASGSGSAPLRLGVLMECADPLPSPDDLPEWVELGLVAIGMAWWHQSCYAGGNGTDNAGLTDLGRALVPVMDDLGVVHDLSHLSQRATDELLTLTDAPVIASHSNCRALLDGESNPDWQRHLSDDTIREIARRGGVIGLNLVRNFIRTGLDPKSDRDRPTVDEAAAHVDHICEVVGDRAHVGLGSDMDGGITANDLPEGINTPSDLSKITDALRARGWSDADLAAFRSGNWNRFWTGSEAG
ncbi:MAG: dipeptidase [Phycisphaerales bacterium JB059]